MCKNIQFLRSEVSVCLRKDYLVQDVLNSTTVVANLHSASVASAFCCHSFACARQPKTTFCLVPSNDVAGKHSSHTC